MAHGQLRWRFSLILVPLHMNKEEVIERAKASLILMAVMLGTVAGEAQSEPEKKDDEPHPPPSPAATSPPPEKPRGAKP